MKRLKKHFHTSKPYRVVSPQETLRRALASEYVINTGASSTVGGVRGIKDSQEAALVVNRILERAGSNGWRTT